MEGWRHIEVAALPLHRTTRAALERSPYSLAGELADLSDAELLRLHNFGRRSLVEVRRIIGALEQGLSHDEIVAPPTPAERRAADVLAMKRAGKTLASIAADLGVTRSRAGQLADRAARREKDGNGRPTARP